VSPTPRATRCWTQRAGSRLAQQRRSDPPRDAPRSRHGNRRETLAADLEASPTRGRPSLLATQGSPIVALLVDVAYELQ
jgi:hypothetical protein